MQIFSFLHPELGIVFIKANSREEAQRAGQAALGSNLTFRESGRTIEDARRAVGARLYGVRNDGALITSGTAGITNGQDNPNMVDFFTNLSSAESSLNAVPPTQLPAQPVIDPDITPLQGNVQAPIATEEQSLFANFLRGLQDRGAGLSGIAGQARVNRFQPLQAQFLAEQVLNPGVAGTPLSFAEFSRTAPLAGAQQGQRAVQLFNQALQRSRGLSPIGAEFDALTEREQGFLNPTTSGQAQALEDLSRAAARQQFGVASEFFRPNVDLFQQFQAQARPTAQSFADFLNQRIFGG
jgi:hypothetical protein